MTSVCAMDAWVDAERRCPQMFQIRSLAYRMTMEFIGGMPDIYAMVVDAQRAVGFVLAPHYESMLIDYIQRAYNCRGLYARSSVPVYVLPSELEYAELVSSVSSVATNMDVPGFGVLLVGAAQGKLNPVEWLAVNEKSQGLSTEYRELVLQAIDRALKSIGPAVTGLDPHGTLVFHSWTQRGEMVLGAH